MQQHGPRSLNLSAVVALSYTILLWRVPDRELMQNTLTLKPRTQRIGEKLSAAITPHSLDLGIELHLDKSEEITEPISGM